MCYVENCCCLLLLIVMAILFLNNFLHLNCSHQLHLLFADGLYCFPILLHEVADCFIWMLHFQVSNSWSSHLHSSFHKEGEEDVSIYHPLSTYLHRGIFSDTTDYLLVILCAINILLAGLKGNMLWLIVLLPYHLKVDYTYILFL